MAMMKTSLLAAYGDTSQIKIATVTRPEPGPG